MWFYIYNKGEKLFTCEVTAQGETCYNAVSGRIPEGKAIPLAGLGREDKKA